MEYGNMVEGIFLARPNRFIAHVRIRGREEICHVKNTGRCRELLPPGAKVWCQQAANPHRKTGFDLIAVQKGTRLINMDSQAPNAVCLQWLREGGLGPVEAIKPETTYGNSRFDLSFVKDGRLCYMEVKGVTLEDQGICAFPDAPTQRGERHVRELIRAAQSGFGAYILFVIQMADVVELRPNRATDPAFAAALEDAQAAGVQILAMDCQVTHDSLRLRQPVPVRL